MQRCGHAAHGERDDFFGLAHAIIKIEIAIKTHPVWIEDQPGGAEGVRAAGNGPQTFAAGFGEDEAAGVDGEEIHAVHEDVGLVQEVMDVGWGDRFFERADVEFRIDGPGLLGHDVHFGPAQGMDRRSVLAIEICQFVSVGVGDGEFADP